MATAATTTGNPLRPPDLHFGPTGEKFEFQTSAKGGDGVFRFRWTLAKGKKGPPEHIHETERETFTVVSGTLRLWLDGVPHDLTAGMTLPVEAGQRHRFFNPGDEPVVVDVSLDGPLQEDALVPLAHHIGSRKMRFGDFCVLIVHASEVNASAPPSAVGRGMMRVMSGMFRLFGVRPLPRASAW